MSKLIPHLTAQTRARRTGPVLTPTQRPGLIAALERALQRAQLSLGLALH